VAYVARISTDQDIYAVEVATGEKTRLTNTAYDETSPVWSPDGRSLFFSSNRYGHSFPEFTGKWDIYRLHLTPPPPTFDEDEFEALFREPDSERAMDEPVERRGGGSGTAAGTDEVTVTLELENIDRQTEQVANTLGSEREPLISPKDSDTVYFLSNLTGRSQLWKVTREDDRWGRYEEFAPSVSSPGNLQFDPTGRWLFYTSGGRLGRIDMNTGRGSGISFSTRIEVDKTDDYRQMLAELAYVLEYYYYDPGHHTADWRRVYEEYLPVLEQVREDTDFYEYANEMIGRLNSSHTGIRPPSGGFRGESSAHLGARLAVGERRITIEHIFRDGPLWAHRDRVAPGDELLAIDGEEVSVDRNIWPLLNGKLGRRVTLTIRSATADSEVVIPIEPISGGAESGLMQEEWIESCRERVREATGDRSAYIYMSAMGSGDLNRFLLELERDGVPREGLILDLRWNMGGNVHDRVLEALCRPVYAAACPRRRSPPSVSPTGRWCLSPTRSP
jgi:tricorn protease